MPSVSVARLMLVVLQPVDELTGQQVGVAVVDDGDLAQHLANDDLDVLVVDRHTLRAVDALHTVDEVLLHRAHALDPEDLLRVDGADDELLAELDVLAVLDEEGRTLEHRVGDRLVAVVGREDDLAAAVGVLDRDATRRPRRSGDAPLGVRASKSSVHAGQTLRDVIGGCRTTGVEGTHRELGAGLTDRLGRDDADGLADVDELAGGERTAVAGRADTDGGLTGEHRAHLDALDAGRDQLVDEHVADVVAGLGDDLALGVDRVLGEAAGVDRVLDVRVANQLARRRPAPRSAGRGPWSCRSRPRG